MPMLLSTNPIGSIAVHATDVRLPPPTKAH
jgi:hypothetical protein